MFHEYFCGHKISDYGIRNGRVDYRTLSQAFDAVLNNEIMQAGWDIGNGWEKVNGDVDNSDEIDALQEQIDDLTTEQQAKTDSLQDEIDELQVSLDDAEEKELDALADVYRANIDELEKQIIETEKKYDEMIEKLQSQIDELEYEQDHDPEVYQWYIISDAGADILKDYTNEQVYYHEELDMYLWGVTHWGTSWDYVLTDIPCGPDDEEE